MKNASGADSGATVVWSAFGTYQWGENDDAVANILKYYLDDSVSTNPEITISGVPFPFYDVIVYQASDNANVQFNPPRVNGVCYDVNGRVTASPVPYGSSRQNACREGVNVIYLRQAFADRELTLVGGGKADENGTCPRGSIAAVQLVEVPSVVEETVSTDTDWTSVPWTETAGRVLRVVNTSGNAAIGVEQDATAGLDTIRVTERATFSVNAVLTVTNGLQVAEDAILTLRLGTNAKIEGSVVFAETAKLVLYLPESMDEILLPIAGLNPSNLTVYRADGVEATDLYLSDFGDGTTLVSTTALTMGFDKWVSADGVRVRWAYKENGEWQTIKTLEQLAKLEFFGTIDGPYVTGGPHADTRVYHFVATNGLLRQQYQLADPDKWLKIIRLQLTVNDDEITAKAERPRYIQQSIAAVGDDLWDAGELGYIATAKGSGIGYGIYNVKARSALCRVEEADANYVDFAEAVEMAQKTQTKEIALFDGKTAKVSDNLNLGTVRLTGTGALAFAEGVSLSVTMKNPAENVVLKTTTLTQEQVTVYDAQGNESAFVFTFDETAGTVTLALPTPTWSATNGSDFDATANWTYSDVGAPDAGDVIVRVAGETTVNLTTARTYGTVFLRGEGRVAFTASGVGALTAATFDVGPGVTLVRQETSPFTGALTFAETAKLELTLPDGTSELTLSASDLPVDNLTVLTSDGAVAPTVYASHLADRLVLSTTPKFTFGEGVWIPGGNGVSARWAWRGNGGDWRSIATLADLAHLEFVGNVDGPWVNGTDQFADTRANHVVLKEGRVRLQFHAPDDRIKVIRLLANVSDGEIAVVAEAPRYADYSNASVGDDLWESGYTSNIVTSETDGSGYGIHDVQAKPAVARVEATGANFASLDEAWTAAAGTSSGALTVLRDCLISADATFANGVKATVADGATLTVATGTTLNLGTSRINGALVFEDGAFLTLTFADQTEVVTMNATGLTSANLTVLDANGDPLTDANCFTGEDGIVTVSLALPKWTAAVDGVFETNGNWQNANGCPSGGNIVVEVAGDTTVQVNESHDYETVYLQGAGRVVFRGAALEATEFVVAEGTTYVLDASGLADGLSVTTPISGAGAVLTKGDVTMACVHSFLGGLTVTDGIVKTTNNHGYGGPSDNVKQAVVTVADGGCVDLANTWNYSYALTIAGRGVKNADGTYSGALMSSIGMTDGSCQAWKIALSADALIRVDQEWGLVAASWSETTLDLAGHTLTVSGNGGFILAHVAETTPGTIRVQDGVLRAARRDSTLTGVNIVVEGGSELKMRQVDYDGSIGGANVSGYASVVFRPTSTQPAKVYAVEKLTGVKPLVDAGAIDPTTLTVGQELTLVENLSPTAFAADAFTFHMGGRFDAPTVSETAVTATVGTLANFWHYDFNDGVTHAKDGAAADDSTYVTSGWGSSENPKTVGSRNGRAAVLFRVSDSDQFVPSWGGNSAERSPFAAGVATITTVLRADGATDKRIVWSLGGKYASGVALVIDDEKTLSLVAWTDASSRTTLATITDIPNLKTSWHFVAATMTQEGTTLQVDGEERSTTAVCPFGIGVAGQLGSVYQGAIDGYQMPDAPGVAIDDWRVYDARLTAKELKTLRQTLVPTAFFLRVR